MTRIAVYDVAADSGGALTVLSDYYARAKADSDNEYLFIVSVPKLEIAPNIEIYRAPKIKSSWFHRVVFDLFIAHCVINDFNADTVVSLQSMVVPFAKQRQIVYIHNSLPKKLCDLHFSIADEPKMWVYQNIIGSIITHSALCADTVIVQNKWLANRLAERCGVKRDRIIVEPPRIKKTSCARRMRNDSDVLFFYPASAVPFKNHELIVSACEILKNNGVHGYRVVFTIDGSENSKARELRSKAKSFDLPIEFHGWIPVDEMDQWYANADALLFPSRLETLGLPLIEVQPYDIPIIAADLEYARETVGNYKKVKFCNPTDPVAMSLAMRGLVS